MFIFEILVLAVVFAFIANGMRAGAIETLGRLFGSVFGFLAAKYYSAWAIGILGLFMPSNWAYLVAFTLIFLAVDFAIGSLFKLAEKLFKVFTRLPILKQINGLLGAILGFCESVIVIGGVNWLLNQGALAEGGLSFVTSLRTVKVLNALFQFLLAFLL